MAGAGGYGALFLPPPVCPEKNLVAQNYAANTLHTRTRESSHGGVPFLWKTSLTLRAHARELAAVRKYRIANFAHPTRAHARELAHDALKRCVSLSHPTRAHVKRCKRTGKTTETVFEDLLSTPHAHYRLFVYSTRTIKINIFRERVGTQVFPHSDFSRG